MTKSFENMLADMENYRPTFSERVKQYPRKIKFRFNSLRNEVKHRVARMQHGWSYVDVWSWDMWHARIVAESLEHYAEVCHGWPGEEWGTFEEYTDMILEIAGAYRAYYEFPDPVKVDGQYDFNAHHALHEEMMDRLKKANEMMVKNYYSIWD